ncbi:MAG: hypothetical protein H0T47_19635 [Planctomycetaceae bacterium]|nr:hypothetical protein [Planctomycetaceae bacterium]
MSDVAAPPVEKDVPKSIYLVAYPKVVLLYPTFFAAIAAGIYMAVTGGENPAGAELTGLIFLGIFALNLVVLSFDFPRTASLTLVFLIFGVVMGLILFFRSYPDALPAVTDFLKRLRPVANATFYFTVAMLLGLIYLLVLVSRRFDYWEIRPNELLHHTGLLSDLKRYSAPNLRIDKEINDVFEYVLMRSGTLILHPSQERRAIVLENVPNISRKEAQITKMLGALQVQVRKAE